MYVSIDRIDIKTPKEIYSESRGILCITLDDSVYFESYVIDLYNSVITHIDSPQPNNSNNATLSLIADTLFGDESVTHQSYYKAEYSLIQTPAASGLM